MRRILSRLRSWWTEPLPSGAVWALTDDSVGDARSADLYECSSCESVLIEPPSEACSQCPSGTLEKV